MGVQGTTQSLFLIRMQGTTSNFEPDRLWMAAPDLQFLVCAGHVGHRVSGPLSDSAMPHDILHQIQKCPCVSRSLRLLLQMTRSEFLEQREEIGRIWKRQAPDGDDFSSTVSLPRGLL